MTPTEKAKELYNYFYQLCADSSSPELLSKQCLLICVDEIINDNPNIYDSDRLNFKYWNSVKQEINKL